MKKHRMPIFPGAFSVATRLLNMPEFALVKEALGYARTEPHVADWPLVKDQLDTQVLERVFTDPEADVEEILMEAAAGIQESYF